MLLLLRHELYLLALNVLFHYLRMCFQVEKHHWLHFDALGCDILATSHVFEVLERDHDRCYVVEGLLERSCVEDAIDAVAALLVDAPSVLVSVGP